MICFGNLTVILTGCGIFFSLAASSQYLVVVEMSGSLCVYVYKLRPKQTKHIFHSPHHSSISNMGCQKSRCVYVCDFFTEIKVASVILFDYNVNMWWLSQQSTENCLQIFTTSAAAATTTNTTRGKLPYFLVKCGRCVFLLVSHFFRDHYTISYKNI